MLWVMIGLVVLLAGTVIVQESRQRRALNDYRAYARKLETRLFEADYRHTAPPEWEEFIRDLDGPVERKVWWKR